MSVILLCRLLPFHVWPFWLRMVVWCTCALGVSLAVHRLYIHAVGPWHHGAIQNVSDGTWGGNLAEISDASADPPSPLARDIVRSQQHRLDAVHRKLEGLPVLRLKGAEVIRCTGQKAPAEADMPSNVSNAGNGETDLLAVFAKDLHPIDGSLPRVSAKDMTCPEVNLRAGGVTSSAALLAWIEQIILASDVALRRFEPVVHDLAQQLGGLHVGERVLAVAMMTRLGEEGTQATQEAEGEARGDDVALMDRASMPATYRAADIEISGSYLSLYRFLEQLARTEPPLIIVSSRVRSDDTLMRWEARVVVTDAGQFRLGNAPGVAGEMMALGDAQPPNGTVTPNPFARSVLPGTAQAARLIGVMRLGSRRVGLFAQGSKRYLLEAGAMLGDARIVGIHSEDGTSRAELAPLTGESPRVLWLRSRN